MKHTTANLEVVSPRSRFYHGPFGRLFPDLPPWKPVLAPGQSLEDHFRELANTIIVEAPGRSSGDIASDPELRATLDGQFNSNLPAAYTYFGQFIDHDITHDVTPLSQAEIDPNRLHNFRTPRFDLDCVYGMGPDEQPYLYEQDSNGFTGKMLLETRTAPDGTHYTDLPRNLGTPRRAIIGDMRNDENANVANLQIAFISAHNTLVDRAKDYLGSDDGHVAFEHARETLTRLYQWIVWHDFAKRISHPHIHKLALQKIEPAGAYLPAKWKPGLTHIYSWHESPFMPVEFSVAAYRFGHTLVRNSYRINAKSTDPTPIFDATDADNDLGGFRELTPERVVTWSLYLQMVNGSGLQPQFARKFDTKLSNALTSMRMDPDANSVLNFLGARNLIRGVGAGLPSGPSIAKHLGIEVIDLDENEPAGLWFYILKEAEVTSGGTHLGPLGSLIIDAVFAGLLIGDPRSFYNLEPSWTPNDDPLLKPNIDNIDTGIADVWELASIIRLSGLPIE